MTIFVNGQEVGASGGLPTATGANQLPVSTGAGTTYVATDAAGTRTALGLGTLATASSVTASQISDSTAAGRTILTAANAAAQKTALAIASGDVSGLGALATASSINLATQTTGTLAITSGGTGSTTAEGARTALGVPRSVTLYASDATAESGSATASISGTGASSTFTLSTTSQTVAYTASATTAPRILLTIPANAVSISLEMRLSSVSGFANTNSICLVAALRPTGGGTPARLWGLSWVDTFGATQVLIGNLSTAANGGAGLGSLNTAFFGNGNPEADRWMRASWSPLQPWLGASFGKAASAGARPAYWLVPSTQVTSPTSAVEIVDSTLETQIAVYISTLSNRTCSVTGTLTARALVL